MSWAKVDDHANEHEKHLAAGAKACWLWTCGLMYANRQPRKTGRIPKSLVGMLYPGVGKREAQKLVSVGLWHDDGDAYTIHDYKTWNPELREKRAEAGRKGGKRSGEARREANAKQSASEKRSKNEASASSNPAGARVRALDPPHPTPPQDQDPTESESAKDLSGQSPPEESHARSLPADGWDDRDTPCPLDLRDRAEQAGVLRELSDALQVPLASVDDSAREFVSYWTVGAGTGKRRRHWLTKLREHVRRAHRERRLRAPGEIEHDAGETQQTAADALMARVRALPRTRT